MKSCTIKLKSTRKSISQVEAMLFKINEELGFETDRFQNLIVAVTEIVMNSIIHGHKENENKCIEFSCNYNDECVEVKISDEGNGFNYESLPDPTLPENLLKNSGRGIFVARTLVDEFVYQHTEAGSVFILKVYNKKKAT